MHVQGTVTSEVREWLLDWFENRDTWNGQRPSNEDDVNYFESGWIDSLGVIEMIEDVEARFDVRIEADCFQDRRFATLNGLSEIIIALSQNHS
jgi:acyl carrier protein